MPGSGVQTRACAVVHLYTGVREKLISMPSSIPRNVSVECRHNTQFLQISFQNFLNLSTQVNMSRRAIRNFNRRRRNNDYDSLEVQLTYGVPCSVGCGHDCDPMFGHMPEPWCCKRCFTSKGTEHDEECAAYVEPTPNATAPEPIPPEQDLPKWTRYRDFSGNHWWHKTDEEWFYESTGTKDEPQNQ